MHRRNTAAITKKTNDHDEAWSGHRRHKESVTVQERALISIVPMGSVRGGPSDERHESRPSDICAKWQLQGVASLGFRARATPRRTRLSTNRPQPTTTHDQAAKTTYADGQHTREKRTSQRDDTPKLHRPSISTPPHLLAHRRCIYSYPAPRRVAHCPTRPGVPLHMLFRTPSEAF
ncbi:hypothetical protein EK21DRAFT_95376 [Setomelanomma holmii]|uniref:Uncharacterized protein n=1 Tax=Setomelanomma holmii TaxID=210430 RepID=A0A9P4GW91_9PLEO|nr:hypothetical protein EK21DRAFT_95376 [Setomelanomma holmii]